MERAPAALGLGALLKVQARNNWRVELGFKI